MDKQDVKPFRISKRPGISASHATKRQVKKISKDGDCYLTKACEGTMVHALLGSFCNKCGVEIDFHGDVVPPNGPYRPGFKEWSAKQDVKAAYNKATKAEVKKMAMKNTKTVEVTLSLPALDEGYEYTGECELIEDVNGFHTGGLFPCIKKLPFRAMEGRTYFYLREDFAVADSPETDNMWDRARWNAGNYFETGQAARDMADVIKGCLDNLRS